MPRAWIEKNVSQKIKLWAFDRLHIKDVLFATNRDKQGFPTVAEIPVSDANDEKFHEFQKVTTVIMFAPGVAAIDDPDYDFKLDDIQFFLEYCD